MVVVVLVLVIVILVVVVVESQSILFACQVTVKVTNKKDGQPRALKDPTISLLLVVGAWWW